MSRRLAIGFAAALALGAQAFTQQRPYHGRMQPPQGAGPWGGRGGPPAPPPFDPRQHNGYWLGHRWFYGPPPGSVIRGQDFRPGFAPFRPGGFLPPEYQGQVLEGYERLHLRRPPFGYHWVQAGNEYLLVSTSTGQIFDVVTGF